MGPLHLYKRLAIHYSLGQSYLNISSHDEIACFHGTLDIKTLGGAGFASQRTTGEDREWDLSDFSGIELNIIKGDTKRYTFNLKDTLLEKDPETGRDQASISYEYDFKLEDTQAEGKGTVIYIPFDELKATYRGRPKEDADPIKKGSVKRLSLMMRSFFGDQEGPFELSLRSISAVSKKKDDKTPTVSEKAALAARYVEADEAQRRPTVRLSNM